MNQKILIVEDEEKIANWVKSYFEKAGFLTVSADNGLDGLELARTQRPDLIVLDWMLPGMSGMEVCSIIRKESNTPIIMLTARDKEYDRIMGLESGADDYVVKPFSPNELVARAKAVLRRSKGTQQTELTTEAIQVNVDAHTCTVRGSQVKLSRTQFLLLTAFMRHPEQVLTREQLLAAAFNEHYEGFDRTIDVHIRRLRRQVEEDPSNPKHILTVYGVGYKFTP